MYTNKTEKSKNFLDLKLSSGSNTKKTNLLKNIGEL